MASKKPIVLITKPFYSQCQFARVNNSRCVHNLPIPYRKADRNPIHFNQNAKGIRYFSTSEKAAVAGISATRPGNLLLGTTVGLVLVFGYLYTTDTRAGKSAVCAFISSGLQLTSAQ